MYESVPKESSAHARHGASSVEESEEVGFPRCPWLESWGKCVVFNSTKRLPATKKGCNFCEGCQKVSAKYHGVVSKIYLKGGFKLTMLMIRLGSTFCPCL